MEQSIIIIAEHFEGKIRPITYELIGFARHLGALISHPVKAVILGQDIDALAHALSRETGVDVTGVEFSEHVMYNSQVYKSAIEDLMKDLNPSYVCIGHTTTGLDFAPGVSVRIKAPCISGVNGMDQKEGIRFSRPIANGKINIWMCPERMPCVLTIQPGIFGLDQTLQTKDTTPGHVSVKNMTMDLLKIHNRGITKTSEGASDLHEAKILVAAGRGIGKEENLKKIEHFASFFPGSKVAGSRPMIDLGWMPYKKQVGITGAMVAPDLYIACGISGSSQHIAGMRGSKFIVAINSDANAAIYNIADVCITADVLKFIDVFEKELLAISP